VELVKAESPIVIVIATEQSLIMVLYMRCGALEDDLPVKENRPNKSLQPTETTGLFLHSASVRLRG
jgi:hypothetical protein